MPSTCGIAVGVITYSPGYGRSARPVAYPLKLELWLGEEERRANGDQWFPYLYVAAVKHKSSQPVVNWSIGRSLFLG